MNTSLYAITLAEFIGTFLLILLGDGVVANVLLKNSKGEKSGWIVISTGWGFAVSVAVYAIGWISGGHVNPAVSIAMFLLNRISMIELPFYLIGQFTGAIVGALATYITYRNHFFETKEAGLRLMVFCTKPALPGTFTHFFCEMIATFVLIVGVLTLFDHHNHLASGLAPFMIGILVFSIGLSLGGPTGYAINPARDLGPRITHSLLSEFAKESSEWHYAWIPIVAPIVGSALGVCCYLLLSRL